MRFFITQQRFPTCLRKVIATALDHRHCGGPGRWRFEIWFWLSYDSLLDLLIKLICLHFFAYGVTVLHNVLRIGVTFMLCMLLLWQIGPHLSRFLLHNDVEGLGWGLILVCHFRNLVRCWTLNFCQQTAFLTSSTLKLFYRACCNSARFNWWMLFGTEWHQISRRSTFLIDWLCIVNE